MHRTIVAVVGAVLVLASAAPASRAEAPPGFAGCRAFTSKAPVLVVKPRSIVVACADANFYLTGIAWKTWATTGAGGNGVAHANDCTPNCAAGHFHTYPVAVRLSKARRCGPKRLQFTTLAWTFTAAKPAGVPRNGSESFRCA